MRVANVWQVFWFLGHLQRALHALTHLVGTKTPSAEGWRTGLPAEPGLES